MDIVMTSIAGDYMGTLMKVVDSGVVFAAEDGTDRQSNAFHSICVLPSGRWICGFRSAPTKNGQAGQCSLITWSDDDGHTWSEPVEPFMPPSVEGSPGLFRGVQLTALGGSKVMAAIYWVDYSDPSLPFFNESTSGLLDSRIFLACSEDEGESWAIPELIDTSPFNVPTPITGPVLALPDGELACQFETNKHYYATEPWRHVPVLMFSYDGGRCWPEHAIPCSDPSNRVYYWDQRPRMMEDGRMLNLFWTYDNYNATYLNIHAAESFDYGRTWSGSWDTGVSGQPAQPVSLADGRIAMVYVTRDNGAAIRMRLSKDGGRTWPESTEVIIYEPAAATVIKSKQSTEDAWSEMEAFSFGLPATAMLPDGEILAVYYAGPEADRTGIYWSRIRP